MIEPVNHTGFNLFGTCFEGNPKMMGSQKFVPQDICQTTE